MSNHAGFIRDFRARSRPVALALLALLGAQACTTWQPSTRPIAQVVKEPNTTLRVTRANLSTVEMRGGHIRGDTLFGSNRFGSAQFAIPLADVRSVQVSQVSVGKTLLVIAALGISAAIVTSATNNPPPPPPPPPRTSTPIVSCPLVYTWDGTEWRLDSGTFGGAIMRALQRTDVDNLDFATPERDVLRLKVANELNETDHIDALRVVAVDHEPGFTVAPDARGELHTLGRLSAPIRAADFAGRDALARVAQADGWNWESAPAGRDSAKFADIRDGLELTFVRPAGASRAHVVLDGNNSPWAAYLLTEYVRAHGTATQAWYDSLNANPAAAAKMGSQIAREAFLTASVWTGSKWAPQGMFWEAGPEIVKRQALDVDLSQVQGDTVRVRLESVPSFWLIDRVAIDYAADRPLTVTELPLTEARDRDGRDVRPLINAEDDRYYTLETGDAAELKYTVPALGSGLVRSYLLRSTGWYRVHTPVAAEPDLVTLHRVAHEPYGLSRTAVGRLNDALRRLERSAR